MTVLERLKARHKRMVEQAEFALQDPQNADDLAKLIAVAEAAQVIEPMPLGHPEIVKHWNTFRAALAALKE